MTVKREMQKSEIKQKLVSKDESKDTYEDTRQSQELLGGDHSIQREKLPSRARLRSGYLPDLHMFSQEQPQLTDRQLYLLPPGPFRSNLHQRLGRSHSDSQARSHSRSHMVEKPVPLSRTEGIRKRKKHRKSHLGCANCKQRRIKCDERLPECTQCIKYRVSCSYLQLSDQELAELKRRKAAEDMKNSAIMTAQELASLLPSSSSSSSATATIASSPNSAHCKATPHAAETTTVPSQRSANLRSTILQQPSNSSYDIYRLTPETPSSYYPPIGLGPDATSSENPIASNFPFHLSRSRSVDSALQPYPSHFAHLYHTNYSTDLSHPSLSWHTFSFPRTSPGDALAGSAPDLASNPPSNHGTSQFVSALRDGGFNNPMLTTLFQQFIDGIYVLAASDEILYHSIMSFSSGFQSVRTHAADHRLFSHAHRACALRLLQRELTKPSVSNPDCLVCSALILSWDSFFQQDDIKAYVTLSKGVGTILEKAELANGSSHIARCMKSTLLEAMKCIHVPPYGAEFIPELYSHIQRIGPYIALSRNTEIIHQHQDLLHYMAYVLDFIHTNSRTIIGADSDNGASTTGLAAAPGLQYYPPQSLFHVLRKWLQLFPVQIITPPPYSNLYHEFQQLLYLYYHAVTIALDAIFPEVRYIFQFGFMGPVDSSRVENIMLDNIDPELTEYPLKIWRFFQGRGLQMSGILANMKPTSVVNPRKEAIYELSIPSFDAITPSSEHHPMIVPIVHEGLISPPPLETSCRTDLDDSGHHDFFQLYMNDRMTILQA